jgi:hypothetical protein
MGTAFFYDSSDTLIGTAIQPEILTRQTIVNCISTHLVEEIDHFVVTDSIVSLAAECFYLCTGLTSIPNFTNVTSFGINCFRTCTSLTTIPNFTSITSLPDGCFSYCTALKLIPNFTNITSFGNDCFHGCIRLTSIPKFTNVISFGDACFYSCTGLTTLPNFTRVSSFGIYCFAYCSSLTFVQISASVTTIGDNCFDACNALHSIQFNNSQNIVSVGVEYVTYSNINTVIYYNASNFNALPEILRTDQGNFSQGTIFIYYSNPYIEPTTNNNSTGFDLSTLITKKSKRHTRNNIRNFINNL